MFKGMLTVTLFIISASAIEPNPYFKTEADIEKFYIDSSVNVPADGRGGFSIDIKNDHKIIEYDNSCLCREDWGAAITFDWDSDSIISGRMGYILGIDFGEGKTLSALSKGKKERAKIALKYLICKSVKGYVHAQYAEASASYKEKKKDYASLIAKDCVKNVAWVFYPITTENVSIYNDLGFFLEQGEKYPEAVTLLEQVIKVVPTREVAYVNLGDSYWGLNKTTDAIGCYKTYVDLMKKEGKEKKISQKVLERLK